MAAGSKRPKGLEVLHPVSETVPYGTYWKSLHGLETGAVRHQSETAEITKFPVP